MTFQRTWSLIDIIYGYLEILRPHNLVVTIFTTYIGYLLVASAIGLPFIPPDTSFLLSATIVVLIAAAGYVINDYYDVEIDAIDKPWRPIPSGRVKREHAKILSLILFGLGCTLGFIIGPLSGIYASLAAILLYEYSRWIKRSGLLGNIVVAFNSASSILYGGIVPCELYGPLTILTPVFIPFIYAFLLVLAREIIKGIEDYHGDSVGGVRTLAVLWGPRKASYFASLLLTGVVVISPIPFIMGWYGLCYIVLAAIVDILAILSTLLLTRSDDVVRVAQIPRRLLKFAFFFGALAFIIGVFC